MSNVASTGTATAPSRLLHLAAEGLLVLVVYGACTLAITWPLFAQPASTLLDPDRPWLAGWFAPGFVPVIRRDIELLVWLFAWDAHAIVSGTGLFDANIFYPTPQSLAYSEHGLGHLPIAGVVQILTGNPVLAHQVNLFASFPLTGLATYALLRHFGTRRLAALLSGFVLAFAPVRLDMMYHSHLLAMQYLVLALLFLDRVVLRGKILDTVVLGATTLLTLLCSYYLAYITAVGLVASAAGSWIVPSDRPRHRSLLRISAAMVVVAAIFFLASRPYLRLQHAGAIAEHTSAMIGLQTLSNAPLENWFLPPALVRSGAVRLERGSYAYLGCTALLALLAFVPGEIDDRKRRARRIGAAIVAVGWIFALGPVLTVSGHDVSLPYRWAMDLVPGFSSMRVPGRFALLVMTGWAILTGLGCDRLLTRLEAAGRSRARAVLATAMILVVVVLDWDLVGTGFAAKPAIRSESNAAVARRLAELPPGPVLDIPFGGDEVGQYMLLSTFHWKPLLNGSSGYVPFSSKVVYDVVTLLPSKPALDLLVRMTGVRYLILHTEGMLPAQVRPWLSARGIEPLQVFGDTLLFRVTLRHAPDLLPVLVACSTQPDRCDELRFQLAPLRPS